MKPVTAPVGFTRDDLVAARKTLDVSFETFGPRTTSDRQAFIAAHRGLP